MPVKWAAAIKCNNKTHHLGYFKDQIDGAKAYHRAARKLHGRFASLNFPNSAAEDPVRPWASPLARNQKVPAVKMSHKFLSIMILQQVITNTHKEREEEGLYYKVFYQVCYLS
jgi:hypothetical protein